ncbi:MAG: tetratricopeptide repeat protein [Polyangiaceae bacterium]
MADRGTRVEQLSGPEPGAAQRRSRWARVRAWPGQLLDSARQLITTRDPTFLTALTPAVILVSVLFVRSPASNYIFDEQEALLANPYVHGTDDLGYLDAFKRDFWGLPPTRSIGSYRPIPNLIWRALWHVSELPWVHHWVNVMLHAVNAALVAAFVFAVTRHRRVGWLAGASFATSAVLTEAVTGVVGIADVLGGLGVLLALHGLRVRSWLMPLAVLGGLALGLFSKESVIVGVPLVTVAALLLAPALHPTRPLRALRMLLAGVAAAAALVGYTYLRRRLFPVELPAELTAPLPEGEPLLQRWLHAFLRWFAQPKLPSDPMNNPLVDADTPHRVAGALRVYLNGLIQVVFPWRLSGDYSFPQEPIPDAVVFPGSVLGGLLLVAPPLASVGLWIASMRRERRGGTAAALLALLALGACWLPVAYFPHSNIAVTLPTVRAERFWYLPVIGSAMCIAVLLDALWSRLRWRRELLVGIVAFFTFQGCRARIHALDYNDDLTFWGATRRAVPRSAKAHLNYSVMVGAHLGDLPRRLAINGRARELAPQWPMAHIYYGDTLCRMKRPADAWPYYERGFVLAPNDPNLIALALQCLWDQQGIESHKARILELVDENRGTWLAYLGTQIVYHGKENGGVEKKYRPRGYDEGPKKK